MSGYLRDRYANILSPKLSIKTCTSELIGVFAFVLLGCGAATLCNASGVYPPESPRMVKVRMAAAHGGARRPTVMNVAIVRDTYAACTAQPARACSTAVAVALALCQLDRTLKLSH